MTLHVRFECTRNDADHIRGKLRCPACILDAEAPEVGPSLFRYDRGMLVRALESEAAVIERDKLLVIITEFRQRVAADRREPDKLRCHELWLFGQLRDALAEQPCEACEVARDQGYTGCEGCEDGSRFVDGPYA